MIRAAFLLLFHLWLFEGDVVALAALAQVEFSSLRVARNLYEVSLDWEYLVLGEVAPFTEWMKTKGTNPSSKWFGVSIGGDEWVRLLADATVQVFSVKTWVVRRSGWDNHFNFVTSRQLHVEESAGDRRKSFVE